MFSVLVRVGTGLLLVLTCGCQPAGRAQFKDGTKLYDRETHHYFGEVVGYEDAHDFHNGTSPQPAILIEPAEGGTAARVWGACSTCTATLDVR